MPQQPLVLLHAPPADATLPTACGAPLISHPRSLFDRLDVDGSGALSRGEVLAEVRRLCPLSKPSDVDALFKRYDVDGSGELEHGEFVAMCRELSLAASKV